MAKKLLPLPGYIWITSTEPDMITLDNNPSVSRAKMPCGHVISQESMTDYCQSLLSQGKHTFLCPYPGCRFEWQYSLVKHVANLTSKEMQDFEVRISQSNPLNQMCPSCQTVIQRLDLNSYCLECTKCSKLLASKQYYFCILCLKEWKMPTPVGKNCGNPECSGTDRRISILATCPEKQILNRAAPAVRGCPQCGTLFEYKEYCTQMCCTSCSNFFCFYCLQSAKTKAELKCRPYDSTCVIAPRQSVLPGKYNI